MLSRHILLVLTVLFSFTAEVAHGQLFRTGEERLVRRAMKSMGDVPELFRGWNHTGVMGVDSLAVNRNTRVVEIYLSPSVTHIPHRLEFLNHLENGFSGLLGYRFRNYQLNLYSRGRPLEEYIPNYFRTGLIEHDPARIVPAAGQNRLVRISGDPGYVGGLSGCHIALWPSHGYHYDAGRARWEWQRARLYGTIEDLFTLSFIQPYLLPMLENAGATVMLPRERDLQVNEVIVDNDGSTAGSEMIVSPGNWEFGGPGFGLQDTLFCGDNPFLKGTHLRSAANAGAKISYIPNIPEDGEYAVYVSWARSPRNVSEVRYRVNYSGGYREFLVDQTIGHGTWIYLGTFYFSAGTCSVNASVILSSPDKEGGYITADAVRFGGGMGNVARRADVAPADPVWSLHDSLPSGGHEVKLPGSARGEWELSGRPRYMEGARYYLQYSGMPDSSVYSLSRGSNDYNDDFMARGEWINFLTGAPMNTTGTPYPESPRIPVDLALAFHTDAGVTPCDSVIGTLAIYSSERGGLTYPMGGSRLAARDLSDLVQSQIVNDMRLLVNERWTRRGLWDRQYSEAWRGQVPTMLLELLSHQNLADMGYGLDPRFRFIAARSIYKGILRYYTLNHGRVPVVQPLPPLNMSMEMTGRGSVMLSWEQQYDPLEPTAVAGSYRVYMRREGSGFGPPVESAENRLEIELPENGIIYSFRVTSLNEGGESMPGETLSVCLFDNADKPVLLVNGFTRISGPSTFDNGEMAGISWWDDPGVPYIHDLSHTGVQYDFKRSSPWLHDDSPGWGASHADMEGRIIPGNSFDFPALYGRALQDAGHSFMSVSRSAFENFLVIPNDYSSVLVIFGEQRGVPSWKDPEVKDFRVFSEGMINTLKEFAINGAGIMVSGSHVGTDMIENNDSAAIAFARDWLGFAWMTNHACRMGEVSAVAGIPAGFPRKVNFNVSYDPAIYRVSAPDALVPACDDAKVIYRYNSNLTGAGILRNGSIRSVTLGFPFETVLCPVQRKELMLGVINFLTGNDQM